MEHLLFTNHVTNGSLKLIFFSEKMSQFTSVCEEAMKRMRIKKMVNGISCYGDVMADNHNQSLGYLLPLRSPCPGPIRLDFSDSDCITVGRGLECTFVLPEQMFEEDKNLNHNKEVSKIKI